MKSRIEIRGIARLYRCRTDRDRGATSVEYAILGSLIAAVIVLIVFNLGNQIRLLFDTVSKGW